AIALWTREPVGRAVPVPVALRVNRADAAVPAGSHQMTGVPTPFGLDEHDLDRAVQEAPAGLDVVGFHLHAVSSVLAAADCAGFVREAWAWARRVAGRHRIDLREVNVGGGLGLAYTGAGTFDLDALRTGLAGLSGSPLVVEPGRFLSGPAG